MFIEDWLEKSRKRSRTRSRAAFPESQTVLRSGATAKLFRNLRKVRRGPSRYARADSLFTENCVRRDDGAFSQGLFHVRRRDEHYWMRGSRNVCPAEWSGRSGQRATQFAI